MGDMFLHALGKINIYIYINNEHLSRSISSLGRCIPRCIFHGHMGTKE
jgi:hypothetical protein